MMRTILISLLLSVSMLSLSDAFAGSGDYIVEQSVDHTQVGDERIQTEDIVDHSQGERSKIKAWKDLKAECRGWARARQSEVFKPTVTCKSTDITRDYTEEVSVLHHYNQDIKGQSYNCLLYTSPSPRDRG